MTTADAARTLQRYAKRFHAGAFSTPIAQELEEYDKLGLVHRWPGAVGVETRSTRPLRRRDFTGIAREIPAGRVLTHLALEEGAAAPDLSVFNTICAYVEDLALISCITAQGFSRECVIVTASSALIGVYANMGVPVPDARYEPWDDATLTELLLEVPLDVRERVALELEGVRGYGDSEAYYHKGEWSQVTLRGFKPQDPFYDTKPSEMSRVWKQEHPADLALTSCYWTVLAEHTPALRQVIQSVPWWSNLERVRLLRLTTGQLKRHTDITDRAAGTRDGQIVRFHIPLVTHPDVRAVAWDLDGRELSVHWAPWHLYYLDQRKPHAAINPSGVARIHLVVDVVSDEQVRQHIAAAHQAVRPRRLPQQ